VCSILQILPLALFGPAAREVQLGRYREILYFLTSPEERTY